MVSHAMWQRLQSPVGTRSETSQFPLLSPSRLQIFSADFFTASSISTRFERSSSLQVKSHHRNGVELKLFCTRGTRSKGQPRILFMSQNKEIISTLNGLIETLKDGQEGYKQSASGVDDPQLKTLFDTLSLQRSKFAGELQNEVVNMGDPDPEDASSVTGSMHRAWINVKSAVTNRDRHAILAEAERGEDAAVSAYSDAMEKNLPTPIKEVVSRQSAEVKAAHDKIRALRDSTAQN